jgi:hypothetical protein
MSQPTNNQKKWIDKLTNLVEKEAYCLQGKDCYMNEIIDLVCQEIRQAKIDGMEMAIDIFDSDYDPLTYRGRVKDAIVKFYKSKS